MNFPLVKIWKTTVRTDLEVGWGGCEQIYLGNVEYVISVRHPHGTSGKDRIYGIFGCTWILKFREGVQA